VRFVLAHCRACNFVIFGVLVLSCNDFAYSSNQKKKIN
jgi:hypothetical protein